MKGRRRPRAKLNPADQKAVQALKGLTRKVASMRPVCCAIFIVHPEDRDAGGNMGVTRLVKIQPGQAGDTLLSAIDGVLHKFRPKDEPDEPKEA